MSAFSSSFNHTASETEFGNQKKQIGAKQKLIMPSTMYLQLYHRQVVTRKERVAYIHCQHEVRQIRFVSSHKREAPWNKQVSTCQASRATSNLTKSTRNSWSWEYVGILIAYSSRLYVIVMYIRMQGMIAASVTVLAAGSGEVGFQTYNGSEQDSDCRQLFKVLRKCCSDS